MLQGFVCGRAASTKPSFLCQQTISKTPLGPRPQQLLSRLLSPLLIIRWHPVRKVPKTRDSRYQFVFLGDGGSPVYSPPECSSRSSIHLFLSGLRFCALAKAPFPNFCPFSNLPRPPIILQVRRFLGLFARLLRFFTSGPPHVFLMTFGRFFFPQSVSSFPRLLNPPCPQLRSGTFSVFHAEPFLSLPLLSPFPIPAAKAGQTEWLFP